MREYVRQFTAMNTDVEAIVVADAKRQHEAEDALQAVVDTFVTVEKTLSRFRAESELSALNRAAGKPFRASPLLYSVVAEALSVARATGGVFDPTVLRALEAAGYDRSFELLRGQAVGPTRRAVPPRCSWRDVRLERERRLITLPAGCGLDLGGIGKGWTVDRAAALLRAFAAFAVDAGGDIYAAGLQVDGRPWTVGVEDPRAPERDLTVLAVRDGAVATSSVAHRRWRLDGREQHHLIDPRTGRPAESGVLAVTAVAPTVARAETMAKTALLLGPWDGLRLLEGQPDVEGLLVLADGRTVTTGGLGEVQRVA